MSEGSDRPAAKKRSAAAPVQGTLGTPDQSAKLDATMTAEQTLPPAIGEKPAPAAPAKGKAARQAASTLAQPAPKSVQDKPIAPGPARDAAAAKAVKELQPTKPKRAAKTARSSTPVGGASVPMPGSFGVPEPLMASGEDIPMQGGNLLSVTQPLSAREFKPAAPAPAPGFKPGPRIYNLFPLLAGRVGDWMAELPRIAGMGFDWVYVNPFHKTGGSGSLYAVADPQALDPRFAMPGKDGDTAIREFCAAAAKSKLRIMTDLVVNHTARDAALATDKPHLFRRDAEGHIESPYAIDPVDPNVRTVWGDLAELDWENEAARAELLPYWDSYVAHQQSLGVKGFRCDAAYKLPPAVWQQLISAARARDAEVLFAAETLGCSDEETAATAGAGFDFIFNSFAWWDFKAGWALGQYDALRQIAPSIAFPENHDMARLAAELDIADPAKAADALVLHYALASAFSAGVLLPMGYEWGYRKPLHVVDTAPTDREDTHIDIEPRIAAINALRAKLKAWNLEGAQWRCTAPDDPVVGLIRMDGGHPLAASQAVIVLANLGARSASIDPAPLIVRSGGLFGRFEDVTPGTDKPAGFVPGRPIALAPMELRIFKADRSAAAEVPGAAEAVAVAGGGRVFIEDIQPAIDAGRYAVKRSVGDRVIVTADIFTDGHDKLAAHLLYRRQGAGAWTHAKMAHVENDRWSGCFPLDEIGHYEFTVEAWRDRWASWTYEVSKKRAAGQKVVAETLEGLEIARAAATRATGEAATQLTAALTEAEKLPAGCEAQLDALLSVSTEAMIAAHAAPANLTEAGTVYSVIAGRLAERFSAWYELFPRSAANDGQRHGTFDDVIAQLPYVRDLGFDVLYFPPIHPIGKTNRKGRNNSLTAGEGDPGSVYAVGAPEGGHDAIHPELGSFEDFRRLVKAAQAHGLELALDFAIQCSPDHPWIKQHPEWFDWRPDGSLKFAENPPKKYEDIVNVDFYTEGALPGLWQALRDVVLLWCREGVRIFRVDNPHTKPLPFWKWLIAAVNAEFPDAIFLAEAFTRPKMMKALGKIGFQQSYTYFTWRNTKPELQEYLTELAGPMGDYYRPNFFVNTPDINPPYLQTGGRAGHIVRATLAATLSSIWGMYQGFELCEATPVPGKEEYLDSEKYQLRAWDFDRPGHIREEIAQLNRIRKQNPALHDWRNVRFLGAGNDKVLAYVKQTQARDNTVLALVNLDPRNRQETGYEVPLWLFDLPDHASIEVEDLLNGNRFTLHGKSHTIALDPATRPAVLWRLIPPAGFHPHHD